MKIEGNEKCHACPLVLASVVFRYLVFRCYSGIPPLFHDVPAIPLVFCALLFHVPALSRHSVGVLCSSVPGFIVCPSIQGLKFSNVLCVVSKMTSLKMDETFILT